MAKAKKLPSGNYRVQVFTGYKKDADGNYVLKNGKRVPDYVSITHPDKNEAELQALQYKKDKGGAYDLTVKQAISRYISSRSNVLSPTTIQGYRSVLKNSLNDILPIKLNKLTQEDIQAVINKLALDHEDKTVHNVHGLLASVLNVYRPSMRINTSLPKRQKKFKELPPVKDIIAAVKDNPIELPAMLAVWLSFSMSEIRGIKKSDIKDGVLTLKRVIVDINNKPVIKEKMKEYDRARKHQLPQYILDLISKCQGDFIVPMNAGQIDYWWEKARDRAGLPHITFHDLRHVNASVMHILHIPDKYAMERGGWKSDTTMKTIYQNVFTDERIKYDKEINDYFNNIVQDV
jgi:integrase